MVANLYSLSLEHFFTQSLVELGNDFISVFTSFGDIVGSVLGFNVNSKKSDVGKYFKTVHDTVKGTKDKLNNIVADMKREGNPNAAGVESEVNKFVSETLDKIIEGAKTASEAIGDASDLIGNVAAGGGGAAAGAGGDVAGAGGDVAGAGGDVAGAGGDVAGAGGDVAGAGGDVAGAGGDVAGAGGDVAGAGGDVAGAGGDVVNLVKGIKDIVDVVLKGVGNAEAGTDKKATDGSSARGAAADNEAGKLFDTVNAGDSADKAKKSAADAAKAVGAVTGADILKAMIKNGIEDSAKAASAKDGTIAGAIALRAMAKGGKFSNTSASATPDVVTAVKGAALSAVTKALDILTIAIRNTIDAGLKEVKEAMKIDANDAHVTFGDKIPEAKS
ncbi:variable large family protein [Borrelia persica]|uniref:variable large family protein n=1 Tax=Borrelia persica TaxID=44448 RepID=UPI00056FC434